MGLGVSTPCTMAFSIQPKQAQRRPFDSFPAVTCTVPAGSPGMCGGHIHRRYCRMLLWPVRCTVKRAGSTDACLPAHPSPSLSLSCTDAVLINRSPAGRPVLHAPAPAASRVVQLAFAVDSQPVALGDSSTCPLLVRNTTVSIHPHTSVCPLKNLRTSSFV